MTQKTEELKNTLAQINVAFSQLIANQGIKDIQNCNLVTFISANLETVIEQLEETENNK